MQIQEKAKVLYPLMASMFIGCKPKGSELSGWKSYLIHEWMVSSKILGSFDNFIDYYYEIKRKERSYAGVNIFYDEKREDKNSLRLTLTKRENRKIQDGS